MYELSYRAAENEVDVLDDSGKTIITYSLDDVWAAKGLVRYLNDYQNGVFDSELIRQLSRTRLTNTQINTVLNILRTLGMIK